MKLLRQIGLIAVAGVLFIGCDSGPSGPEGGGRVQILLTDVPSEYIGTAEVAISRVYLQAGGDEDGEGEASAAGTGEGGAEAGRVDLFNDPDNPLVYDLLQLQDGVTADLTGLVGVEPGEYGQLRLIVQSAMVTLIEGYEFTDGSTEKPLFIPSGAQTGIKVRLNGPVVVEEGTTTILLVDFDVNQNFVLQGNPETPAGIHGVLFTPSLREANRETESNGT